MTSGIVSDRRLLLMGASGCVFYRRGRLYYADAPASSQHFLCEIPYDGVKGRLSRFGLSERMLRLGPRGAAWIDDKQFLFCCKGGIYRADTVSGSVTLEHRFPDGMSAPLSLCALSGVSGFTDGILYGDYTGRRQDISIVRRTPAGGWQSVYTFPMGTVLHIHALIPDPANGRVLILTGDRDAESGIWEAREDFRQVRPLLRGSQQYRSCFAVPWRGHIYYATDTPLEDNGLYDLDEGTGQVTKLRDLPGPVIYGASCVENGQMRMVMATSVEPDSRQTGLRYLLSYRRGPGVKSWDSCILSGSPETGVKVVRRFRKDMLPMTLFQFGNAYFPAGEGGWRYCCPQSVRTCHEKTIEIGVNL